MNVETVGAVHLARTIKADRQTVWNAWTQPDQMVKWSCPEPGGCKKVECDFRVGGAFKIHMIVEGKVHNAFGTYREIVEPARLVYTWDWEDDENAMGATMVTVEFNEVDEGTEVVLVHDGFPVEDARKGHEDGWSACLMHFVAMFD